MKVTNACPQYNPCNTCKGGQSQCRAGHNHIDLCYDTFNHIAYPNKQPRDGINISVEPTSDPEGDCRMTNENGEYLVEETDSSWDPTDPKWGNHDSYANWF